jgi:hypothetical protein
LEVMMRLEASNKKFNDQTISNQKLLSSKNLVKAKKNGRRFFREK